MNKVILLVLMVLALVAGSACESLSAVSNILQAPTKSSSSAVVQTPAASPPTTSAPTATAGPTIAAAPATSLPSITDAVDSVRPAVVSITVRTLSFDYFLQPIPQQGAGSGVVFDAKGYILTNNHVIEDARQIKVALPDGRTFDAELVGRDPPTDLAVIKIAEDNLAVARFGDAQRLRIGEWVVAIGNALALPGGPTVTVGVVSAMGRSIEGNRGTLHDLIQTDAAINPGNSGGPLVNLKGEVVGINTAIIQGAEGIGFAISMHSARPVIDDLLTKGRVIRPWMGVSIQTLTVAAADQLGLSTKEGVLVRGVARNSPATKAGLRAGDVIVSVDDKRVASAQGLIDYVKTRKVGDTLTIKFWRGKSEQTVSLTLVETPPDLYSAGQGSVTVGF